MSFARAIHALLATAWFAYAALALAAPADLDPTFGLGGKIALPIGELGGEGRTVAVQTDGKIVVAGTAYTLISSFALARYQPDGTLDTAFGEGGKVVTTFGTTFADDFVVRDVVVLADGRIVAAGTAWDTQEGLAIARYLANGALDTTFGAGGKVRHSGSFAWMRVQQDGKVVVASAEARSQSSTSTAGYFVLKRWNIDGSADSAFGTAGQLDILVSSAGSVSMAGFEIQTDGKYLLAGNSGAMRLNVDGSPDSGFGVGGTVRTQVGGAYIYAAAMALQSDTKIVLVGSSSGPNVVVIRYLSDGSLDPSFGTGGIATIPGQVVEGIAIVQPDGKVVYGVRVDSGEGSTEIALARYDAAGSSDPTFGTSGIFRTRAFMYLRKAVADTAGRLVLAGTARLDHLLNRLAVGRLGADGGIDSSFGKSGLSALEYVAESLMSTFDAVTIQPDGKILAGGHAQSDGEIHVVVRFNPDGSLDPGFGRGGKASLWLSPSTVDAGSIVLRPDGRILAAGMNYSPPACELGQLLPDGLPDLSFGSGGGVTVSLGGGMGEYPANGVALLPDGRILVACPAGDGARYQFGLARLNADGSLDTTFGTGGFVKTSVGPSEDVPATLAMQPDGKILVAGKSRNTAGKLDFAVARYQSDGVLDPSFGNSGKVTISVSAKDDLALSIAIQPDGRIIVAGSAGTGPSSGLNRAIAAIRLMADGALDMSFGQSGKFVVQWGNGSFGRDVKVASDGKIYLVGHVFSAGGTYFAIVRLTSGGVPDATFGNVGRGAVAFDPAVHSGRAASIQSNGAVVIVGGGYIFQGGASIARIRGGEGVPRAQRHDFSSDARPDIVFREAASGATFVWRMNGTSFGSDQFVTQVDPAWELIGHGDFNHDGKNDLVWRHATTGNTFVWYMNDGTFVSDAFLFSVDPAWKVEAVADFNADGNPDFLMRHATSGVGFIWYFAGTSPVSDQFLYSIDNSWNVEMATDFNGDGYPDLLFRNANTGLAFVWYWNGTALGSSRFLFGIDPVWQVAQVADWNGDGNPDFVFRHRDTGVTFVWYSDGYSLTNSDYLFQVDPSWQIVPSR